VLAVDSTVLVGRRFFDSVSTLQKHNLFAAGSCIVSQVTYRVDAVRM